MDKFKGTKGEWVSDIRGGCAAIYPISRSNDTPGCHYDDERNIAYSNKGAKYNGMHWEMDSSVEHDFNIMAAEPELLEALQLAKHVIENMLPANSHSRNKVSEMAGKAIKKALGE